MSDCVMEVEKVSSVKISARNEKLQRELRRVREENRKLKHIIAYGNISTLGTLIDQYMDYGRIHLKKIAQEIQLMEYEKYATKKVLALIEHLEYIKEELPKLIEVGEEGEVFHNDSLKHDVKMAREMIPKFEEIIQLHIDANKSAALEKVLTEYADKLGARYKRNIRDKTFGRNGRNFRSAVKNFIVWRKRNFRREQSRDKKLE